MTSKIRRILYLVFAKTISTIDNFLGRELTHTNVRCIHSIHYTHLCTETTKHYHDERFEKNMANELSTQHSKYLQ